MALNNSSFKNLGSRLQAYRDANLKRQAPVDPMAKYGRMDTGAEKALLAQFAAAKSELGARQDVARGEALDQVARSQAISGGPTGASEKIKRKALLDVDRAFAAEGAGLGAQQAGMLAQTRGQESQFARTLGLQADIFNKEFQENLKTNFVNAALAFKDAGLGSPKKWADMFDVMSGLGLSQGRVPEGFGNVAKKAKYAAAPKFFGAAPQFNPLMTRT